MERNERKISSYSFRDYKSLPFYVEQASMSNREASLPPEKHWREEEGQHNQQSETPQV